MLNTSLVRLECSFSLSPPCSVSLTCLYAPHTQAAAVFLSWLHSTHLCVSVCVYIKTEKGSALHEAALFGKTEVVQKLLSAGKKQTKQHCLHY